MDPVVVGLLGSLAAVIGLLVLFVCVYRRHLRSAGTSLESPDFPGFGPRPRHRAAALPFPPMWLAVRSSNTAAICDALRIREQDNPSWSDALLRWEEPRVFVSPPVDGWTLVIGGRLPDPAADIDALFRLLADLSNFFGEVQCFECDRISASHGWARLKSGSVDRAYFWTGSTQWNQGAVTLEERLLGMRGRAYGEDSEAAGYGEISPEQTNVERLIPLARRWSIDPLFASDLLVQREEEADESRH